MIRFKKIFSSVFVVIVVVVAGLVLDMVTTTLKASAANVTIDPLIIDHQGLPRDIIKGSFKLTNPNHYKTTVFTTTRNTDPREGEQEFIELGEADLSSSLANWISVSTLLIELNPNETKVIPYEIPINLRAEEGVYHAVMFFPQGASRSEAEAQLSSAPQLLFNVTVGDDGKDRLQVGKFSGPKLVSSSHAKFVVTVNNTGNTTLIPKGEVRIYNRAGEEVASIPVNSEGSQVSPEQQTEFEVSWDKAFGFGRYKAQLVLEFGDKQFQTYQDSIYFQLLPWPLVLFIIMILGGLGLLLVYTAHRVHTNRLRATEEHYEKLLKQKVKQAKQSVAKKYDKKNP